MLNASYQIPNAVAHHIFYHSWKAVTTVDSISHVKLCYANIASHAAPHHYYVWLVQTFKKEWPRPQINQKHDQSVSKMQTNIFAKHIHNNA